MAAANAPPLVAFGVKMVAPIIYTYGNDEQKARFLPDILSSDTWWCQGYSGTGLRVRSGIAQKRRADRDGDHYIVNGTKTWTTLGQHADWIFCLVRTSSDVARRQEGISFLLIDMNTPGVTVRPIITIEGEHEVNEVHFEDVRVPVENLVGEEGKGWTYGKVLLQHERTNIAGVPVSQYRIERLREKAGRVCPWWPAAATSRPQFRPQTGCRRDRTQGAGIHRAARARDGGRRQSARSQSRRC